MQLRWISRCCATLLYSTLSHYTAWYCIKHITTDPELKGGRSSLAARRGCSGGYNKKTRRISARRSTPSPIGRSPVVVPRSKAQSTFPKTRYGASDRKPAQTRQKNLDFLLLSSRPEPNQKLPADTANRRFALIPTHPKVTFCRSGSVLHRITLHCIALHCITFHRITFTLHYAARYS